MSEKIAQNEKKYRPNVAAVIVSSEYPFKCKIFIAQRSDIEDAWQFPQGGIDDGESPSEALLRELKEEIGTKKVEIVAEYPDWLFYDFPSKIVSEKMYPYDGQKQKYFLVRLKKSAKLDIKTKHPEFTDYKFINADKVLDYITHFKKPVYKKVLEYFKKEGYL
ncbi:MAG: RNA pyrophosphohydrolase [Campylobacteraceae bacterium]|nr:RNA pyrophosphohydrolase [Campylobacteraceae bacterium]